MENRRQVLNHLLVSLFNRILSIEERVLKKGPFHMLTIGEMHVIEAVGPTSDLTMSAVAAKLDITISTLSIAVNNLSRKGFVKRIRSEGDRRQIFLALTDKGLEAFEHHRQFHEKMIAHALSALSDDETDVFVRALDRVTGYFEKTYDA